MNNENLLYQNKDVRVEFEYISNFNKEYLTFMLSIDTKMFKGKQEFYLYSGYIDEILQGKIGNIYDCICMEFDIIVDQTVIALMRNILVNKLIQNTNKKLKESTYDKEKST